MVGSLMETATHRSAVEKANSILRILGKGLKIKQPVSEYIDRKEALGILCVLQFCYPQLKKDVAEIE